MNTFSVTIFQGNTNYFDGNYLKALEYKSVWSELNLRKAKIHCLITPSWKLNYILLADRKLNSLKIKWIKICVWQDYYTHNSSTASTWDCHGNNWKTKGDVYVDSCSFTAWGSESIITPGELNPSEHQGKPEKHSRRPPVDWLFGYM